MPMNFAFPHWNVDLILSNQYSRIHYVYPWPSVWAVTITHRPPLIAPKRWRGFMQFDYTWMELGNVRARQPTKDSTGSQIHWCLSWVVLLYGSAIGSRGGQNLWSDVVESVAEQDKRVESSWGGEPGWPSHDDLFHIMYKFNDMPPLLLPQQRADCDGV